MRMKKSLSVAAGVVLAALSLTTLFTTEALADDEFDVSAANGTVVVTAKGSWHINLEYPWKLVAGDTKLDKSKFTLSEKTATLSGAPKGPAKIKGAVCSGDKCKPFEKDVTVQ